MHSIFEKFKILNSIYWQIAVIIFIFIIMIISVFSFNRVHENEHLEQNIRNTFTITESKIINGFMLSEIFLYNYSDKIRGLIIKNDDMNKSGLVHDLTAFMTDITDIEIFYNEYYVDVINNYGYFPVLDGYFLYGTERKPPDGFMPEEMFWYKSSIEAKGKIVISDPYTDPVSRRNIVTMSRCITDDSDNLLGIICIDVNIDYIYNSVVYNNLTKNSYGFLINNNSVLYAHPVFYLTGELLHIAESEIAHIAEDFLKGRIIFKYRVRNYLNEKSFVFFYKMNNSLSLGIVVPVTEYNSGNIYMLVFLIIVGGILAAVLCIMMFQINLAKNKADLRNKQKSNFLATMSHEIRTPLNAILGMTEIQMQNSAHPASAIDAFNKISYSGNLLLNIINDILDLSKIEAGKLELLPVKYDVANLINDVVQLNYIRYDSKPIDFIVELGDNIPLILVGDELRIKQVLNNLLSNAFKYTDKGEVKLIVNAECVSRGGIVLVTLIFKICDTGQGMTAEQINKLFDEYSRFNLEANRTTEGSGLGMTITQNLVNLMQGKISIKSSVGIGTEVTVRIPQRTEGLGIRGVIGKELAENLKQYRKGNAVNIKRMQLHHEYMPYGSVLIVDDVETNLYVAKGLMIPYGLKIDLATSGFEAIEKIKAGSAYDIIFMDHMMPKLDGIEAAKIIRGMGYTLPIVALTANALAGQAEVFMKNGFDGFISKPIDIRQLNVILNKLVRDKQPVEVIEAARKEKEEFDRKHSPAAQKQIDSELAAIFARDAGKAYTVLETIMTDNFKDESDLNMYIINVHSMKSALANIGEMELSATALRLEQAGRDKDINTISSDTQSFLNDLRGVIEKILPKEEDEIKEDTEESLSYLHSELAVIRDACLSFDKKTVKNTLSKLRDRAWSHENRELLDKMAEHLLHSEFDDIAELAKENMGS